MRNSSASNSPMVRPRACCASGSKLTTMEMKMMLSIPNTISMNVRVIKLTQVSGLGKGSEIVHNR